jgi:hypothetical protein
MQLGASIPVALVTRRNSLGRTSRVTVAATEDMRSMSIAVAAAEEGDSGQYVGQVVIRGNSIVQFEGIDRVALAEET